MRVQKVNLLRCSRNKLTKFDLTHNHCNQYLVAQHCIFKKCAYIWQNVHTQHALAYRIQLEIQVLQKTLSVIINIIKLHVNKIKAPLGYGRIRFHFSINKLTNRAQIGKKKKEKKIIEPRGSRLIPNPLSPFRFLINIITMRTQLT